jgi:hypothetical protein
VDTPAEVVVLIVGILVVCFVWLVVLMAAIFWFFRSQSAWPQMAQRYPAPPGPVGTLHPRQTVKVGPVRWRWSMTIGLSDYGLYLEPSIPFGPLRGLIGHPPLLIPWQEIHIVGPGCIYLLWECTELAVGNPRIASLTVPNTLLELLKPYLAK